MTSLLAAQDLRISITTRRCRQRMTGRIVVRGAAQGAEPSWCSPVLLKSATTLKRKHQGERKYKMKNF